GRRVEVIPNGVALRSASPQDEAARPTVAFTGVLSYPPNVSAMLFLAREIWPRVRSTVAGAELVLAGREPAPEISALHGRDGLRLCPDVPDMAAVLRSAWVAAAPMLSGSGIKNKVLEAWAVGRPTVISPLAANGLELDGEAAAWVARDAPEAAEKIARLLS